MTNKDVDTIRKIVTEAAESVGRSDEEMRLCYQVTQSILQMLASHLMGEAQDKVATLLRRG